MPCPPQTAVRLCRDVGHARSVVERHASHTTPPAWRQLGVRAHATTACGHTAGTGPPHVPRLAAPGSPHTGGCEVSWLCVEAGQNAGPHTVCWRHRFTCRGRAHKRKHAALASMSIMMWWHRTPLRCTAGVDLSQQRAPAKPCAASVYQLPHQPLQCASPRIYCASERSCLPQLRKICIAASPRD